MIDAGNITRKWTRTINDFSPEQLQNYSRSSGSLGANPERFIGFGCRLLPEYRSRSIGMNRSFTKSGEHLDRLTEALEKFYNLIDEKDGTWLELRTASELFKDDMDKYTSSCDFL
ncbi:MAG UNVERIFIED_CONTAM: hypothetical protein LVR29_14120 [Microcystis novacekii LVE1205-3]|jgi:type I restriction enzyme M protein